MTTPQVVQSESSLLFFGANEKPKQVSTERKTFLQGLPLVVARLSGSIWQLPPYRQISSSAMTVTANRHTGIATGGFVPGSTPPATIAKVFQVDAVSVIAITLSGSIYLIRVHGAPYEESFAEATAVIGESRPKENVIPDVILPDDCYLQNKDILVVRFDRAIFGSSVTQSNKAIVILSALNTGIAVGRCVPTLESNTIRYLFAVSEKRLIVSTVSGALYFITVKEK